MKNNLSEWLDWIQSLHVINMDLSLERVHEVAKRLDLLNPTARVITVGGTNGKGSCVAGLEAIYLAAGFTVGAFTSPILLRHTEYVRVGGKEVSEEEFCNAFSRIKCVLGDITLTPFEFNALAAFYIFKQHGLDVWILEVGLGGRFDAVNVLDADIAIITSIALDHTEWLGDTREKIAYEKAGIFRKNHPAICGDRDPPQTLIDYAKEVQARFFCQQTQFGWIERAKEWDWWSENNILKNLPKPTLGLQNMATVLMAIEVANNRLPVSLQAIKTGLEKINLPGRIQVFPGDITRIMDVSHNPAAAMWLAKWLEDHPISGKTRAVFSMLMDKDSGTTLAIMKKQIAHWYIAPLATTRATPLSQLKDRFLQNTIFHMTAFDSIADAYDAACADSKRGDRVIVFGSFHTVAEVMKVATLKARV